MHILLIESDRRLAALIEKALKQQRCTVDVFADPDEAIAAADITRPDRVISELSLAGHSGMEFLYEFRSYTDWQSIPVYVYSSLQLDRHMRASVDWQLLRVEDFLYKPTTSIATLVERVCA